MPRPNETIENLEERGLYASRRPRKNGPAKQLIYFGRQKEKVRISIIISHCVYPNHEASEF